MLLATSFWGSPSEKRSLPASPGVRSWWWGWARRALVRHPYLPWHLAEHKSCPPGHTSEPLLGNQTVEPLQPFVGFIS